MASWKELEFERSQVLAYWRGRILEVDAQLYEQELRHLEVIRRNHFGCDELNRKIRAAWEERKMPFADRAGRFLSGGWALPGVPQTADDRRAKRYYVKLLAQLKRDYYGREDIMAARIEANLKIVQAREAQLRVLDDSYEAVLQIVADLKDQLKWERKLEEKVAHLRPLSPSSPSPSPPQDEE
ncbi:unnamed protein product [Nippostrongylus brasiliensis]|uniref:Uncharacterized protein n=1 Tax=Nippostrongylus brasiliensis TaxID=27835 RepID=A0A0N4Y680_NIPBR|nr:unnamed protein product [Nippostrongylus brasiliensis]